LPWDGSMKIGDNFKSSPRPAKYGTHEAVLMINNPKKALEL